MTTTLYHIDDQKLLVDRCEGKAKTCPHGKHFAALDAACKAQRMLVKKTETLTA